MLLLIFASSVIFVVETMESVKADAALHRRLHNVEIGCIIVFTVDYLLRVCTCWSRPSIRAIERESQTASVLRYV
jgi:hypothetical protein